MADQPRIRTLAPSPVFQDGASARPLVEGVVSTDGVYFTSAPDHEIPPPPALTAELLARGREVFGISCVPCHGAAGYGDGMVVQRGYPQPPSYHSERLRTIPDAQIYRVISRGLGKMPPYDDAVPAPRDRWALVAYIRALQLSQHAEVGDVPDAQRSRLEERRPDSAPPREERP